MDPSACCENAFHTGSNYKVVVRTVSVCCPCAKFLLDVFVLLSGAPLSAVVSDAMGVELFFLARTVSCSGAPGRFCAALPPSPFTLGVSLRQNTEE
jgi:hypothetical protein